MKKFISTFLLAFSVATSFAQAALLDPTFGNHGVVTTDMGALYKYNTELRQVITDSTGSLYVLGQNGIVLKRQKDGTIEGAYGTNGYSGPLPFYDTYIALQRDGKILIAGGDNSAQYLYSVARLTVEGKLDTTFGTKGIQAVGIIPAAVCVQNDGKIIVTGNFGDNFAIARLEATGKLDPTFNGGAVKVVSFGRDVLIAATAAIQPDGKTVMAGFDFSDVTNQFTFVLLRYTTNGSIDSTFDKDGIQTTLIDAGCKGKSLAVQNDGKIILAGYAYRFIPGVEFAIARYNTDGSLDNTFNNSGIQTIGTNGDGTVANSVAIQQDGKIIIAGDSLNGTKNDFAVARLNTNGRLDSTFDLDGTLVTDIQSSDDYAGTVVIQAGGKIVVGGNLYDNGSSAILTRYETTGKLDSTFGVGGKLNGDYNQGNTSFNSTAIQTDGKIVSVGRSWNGNDDDFSIARNNVNGTPDSTFSGDGKQTTDFGGIDEAVGVVVQPDGKIIVAGTSNDRATQYHFVVARYNQDGSPDNTFNRNGKLILTIGAADICQSIALQKDGKIVLVGSTSNDPFFNSRSFAILRLNSNGSYDNTFSTDGKASIDFDGTISVATTVAIQSDDKIVVGGRSYSNAQNYFSLARFNKDGSLDNSFSGDGKQTNVFGPGDYWATSVAIQKDGKIVLAGSGPGFAVARYKVNGDLDSTFNTNGFQNTTIGTDYNIVASVAIKDDGRIAVGGSADNYTIVIYNNNGSLDSTFGNKGILISDVGATGNGYIQSLAFANNKLYAVGYGLFPATMGVVARYMFTEGGPLASTFVTAKNGDWSNPTTWQGGVVPTSKSEVIVKHTVTISTNSSCYSLRIESPGYLTVTKGAKLTITH